MLTFDIVNSFLTFWLKPMLLLAFIISITKNSFRFCASSSHWFLTSGFFITVITVILALFFSNTLIPAVHLEILPHMAAPLTQFTLTQLTMSQNVNAVVLGYCLIGGYFLGVFWIFSFQFFGLLEIWSMSRRAERINNIRLSQKFSMVAGDLGLRQSSAAIKISSEINSPLVWGYRSPLILLPKNWQQWNAGRLQRVLAHELAHIARNDWPIKMFSKLAVAIFWPVPLVWVMLRKIEWFSELACDDKVIARYDCRAEYAEDLLAIARQNEQTGWAMAFNRQSQLFSRIQYVLDARNQRNEINRTSKYVNTCLCVGLILPLFFFQASPRAAITHDHLSEHRLVQVIQKDKNINTGVDIFSKPPQWPYQKNAFIQILPDSPKFLEEMTVRADILPKVHKSADKQSASHLSALTLPTPTLAEKGFLPRVLHTPLYPRNALRKGIEGKVIVQFDIDEFGEVFNVRIVYASPHKVFEKSVLKALDKSQFSPMEIQGRPVITKNISETFSFRLENP